MQTPPHHLDFPDAARSELERTIEELVERAQRVLSTQGRLRHLLAANRAVVEELDLEQVLRRIAEAAVELVGAKYGALGVIAPDGHLEQFIHVGIPLDEARAIGHLPEGHGLLGAVVVSGAPIRLEHLADDDRSTGFPAHHPDMDAFLGVPIRVRNEVYGNLYLTNRDDGAFSAEDEELVTALAATAGIAIDNARLFDEGRRRQRWSSALADVTAALLRGEPEDVLGLLADRVASVVDADLVCVILSSGDAGSLRVDAARGPLSEGLLGQIYAEEGSLAGRTIRGGHSISLDTLEGGEQFEGQPDLGPTVAIPLTDVGRPMGALTVSRAPGGARFTASDLELASDFAAQASVALEVARGRADRQRLSLVEDRNRIARDLHDHVIQRLFASGLTLQSLSAVADESLRVGIEEQVAMMDAAIAEIRTAVFALTARPRTATPTLRHRILDVVGELTVSLPDAPRLTFGGPIDLLIGGELADDVVAVVRESLSNVARHANATESTVDVTADDEFVTVTVRDDGIGISSDGGLSSGTRNLAERARLRGGTFEALPHVAGGTRVRWTALLAATPT